MAFKRDLSDPIQRRKQEFDDIMSGKRKSMKLSSLVKLDEDIKVEAVIKKAAPKKIVKKAKK